MAGEVITLLRLMRRARRPTLARRITTAVLVAAGLLAAYAVGARFATEAAPSAVGWRLLAGAFLLAACFATGLAGGAQMTLATLLREGRREDEWLAALPITLGATATGKLLGVVEGAVRAAVVVVTLVVTGIVAAHAQVGADPGLAGWAARLLVSAVIVAVGASAVGTLLALGFAWVVPVQQRELLLVLLVLAGVLVGAAITAAAGREFATGDAGLLWLSAAAERVRELGGADARTRGLAVPWSLGVVFLGTLASLILLLARVAWTAVLRREMEMAARPAANVTSRRSRGEGTRRISPVECAIEMLPAPVAAVLIRDVKQMSRTPRVRLRTAMLAIAVVALSATGFDLAWVLLLLYYAPSEIAREALLASLEEESENLFFLQVVTAGLGTYLGLRAAAGFLVTMAAMAVLVAVSTAVSPALSASLAAVAVRLALVAVASWVAVAGCVVCASWLVGGLGSSGSLMEASPAELPHAALGLVAALLCAGLDLVLIGDQTQFGDLRASLSGWTTASAAAGLLSLVALTRPAMRASAWKLARNTTGD